jgi:hypothetical protein
VLGWQGEAWVMLERSELCGVIGDEDNCSTQPGTGSPRGVGGMLCVVGVG